MGNAATSYENLVVDQNWNSYTSENHKTWSILFNRQMETLAPRACQEYLDGVEKLGFTDAQIPKFTEVNERLKACTGWQIVATGGLIKSKAFFDMLQDKKFPSGNFIRSLEQLDYLEEPDIFHDLFGHIPLLTNPSYAGYMHEYGKGGIKALAHKTTKQLARLNWWTIEFGLIQKDKGLKLYGAGLASSYGEAQYCIDNPSAHHIAFNLERCMRTKVYINDMQPCYFVIKSFEDLFEQAVNTDFTAMYQRFKGTDGKEPVQEFLPFDLQKEDTVLRRGTQEYITPKRDFLEQSISI